MMANPLPASQSIEVLHESAIGAARRLAIAIAKSLDFEPQAGDEIALSITELASNLVKYARNGRLTVTPLLRNGTIGIEIESVDGGPGIADVDLALTDGYSTSGSLGIGLGAVNRLMDELDIHSQPGNGTRVVCRKWVRKNNPAPQLCPLTFGVALRPMQPGQPNGDVVLIKQRDDIALAGIIDGLGHGPLANRAALTARQYVDSHFDMPLQDIFQGVGRACRATRGVVMALARFEWAQRRLSFASVGNIEVKILKHPDFYSFGVRRGIVGVNAPPPLVTDHGWEPGNLMVLHSDGVRTHWGWKDFAALLNQPAAEVAQGMLRALARENDDASVLIIKDNAQ